MTPLHALLLSVIGVLSLCAGMFLCYYVTMCLMRRSNTTPGHRITLQSLITLPSEGIEQTWLEMDHLQREERS